MEADEICTIWTSTARAISAVLIDSQYFITEMLLQNNNIDVIMLALNPICRDNLGQG